MPAANPRTFPTTGEGRLADRFARTEQRVRALQTRSIPHDFVRQVHDTYTMTWDVGTDNLVFPAHGNETDATVTPSVPPLYAMILVTPHTVSDSVVWFRATTANVWDRTSTDFQVHFYSNLPAQPIAYTIPFDWMVVNFTPL